MSANIALCWPNYLPEATVTGAGSYESAYPLQNLTDTEYTTVARTTDATTGSTKIRVTFDTAKTIRVISELNCTCTSAATRRIMAGSTVGASDILDQTNNVWAFDPTDYGFDWRTAGQWWGNAPDSSIYGAPWCPVRVLSTDVTARYWQIEYDDHLNPAGYVQFGGLWMSPMWRPQHGAVHGVREGYVDYSTKQKLANGRSVASRRRAARTVQFELPLISDGHDEYLLRELFRFNRTVEDVFYLNTINDPKRAQMLSFPGTFDDLNAMTASSYRVHGVSIKLTETI